MGDRSNIEWTDATWQPITGCSIVSPGCTNCYAMRLAGGRLRNHPSRNGLTKPSKTGPVWTGEVRFNEEWLTQPLSWRAPRMIFVCAHGDLFHEDVPDAWIDKVFAVMALAPQHTFQVLTKRSSRMRAYCNQETAPGRIWGVAMEIGGRADTPVPQLDVTSKRIASMPLDNVWLGCSAEDQQRYDERREDLENTPAEIRFWSLEPLLGPIQLNLEGDGGEPDWIIVGGESGKGARPMHPDWARSIRDQCAAAGVQFFFKQWGEHAPRWPGTRNEGTAMEHVGKKRAGRLLDGREHNDMPEVRP